MKKIRLPILFVLIVSLFGGCAAKGSNLPLFTPSERVMTKVDVSAFGKVDVFDFDLFGDYVAFMYCDMPDGIEETPNENDGGLVGSEGETVEGESDVPDGKTYDTHLVIYDISKEKVINNIVVDTMAYKLGFVGENIQVWINNEGERSSLLYDKELNLVGKGEGDPKDRREYKGDIANVNTARFPFIDSVFYNTNDAGYLMLIFPDDSGKYYLDKVDDSDPVMASYNKIVLEKSFTDPAKRNEIVLSVKDYENKKCLGTVTVDNSQSEYFSIPDVHMDGKYVVYSTFKADGRTDYIWCWNYTLEAENTNFECTVLTDDMYDDKVKEITKNISDDYGIEFVMTPEYDKNKSDFFDYEWTNELTRSEYLIAVYELEYLLSTLPKDLYTQVLCKDIEDPVADFDKLRITLVGDIVAEDVGAYANNHNGYLNIVYCCEDLNYGTFCHEMMHTMEYRIWNYYKDFDTDWESLNPRKFSYDYDDYSKNYYDHEEYEDYFMRDYSTKDLLEDRATTFESMCEGAFFKNEKWWEEHKPLNKKVKLLIKAITDSYPCAKEINGIKYCS